MGVDSSKLSENDVDEAIKKFKGIEDILPPSPPTDNDDSDRQQSPDHDRDVESESADNFHEGQGDSIEEGPIWMPKLPILSVSDDFITSKTWNSSVFELRELLGAVQTGKFDGNSVHRYLRHYDKETLGLNLNAEIEGYPAMFYVIATKDISIIRQWIKHGGNPNVTCEPYAIPLIAFCIFIGGNTMRQATTTLATLLRFGADPRVIPKAFYDPFCRDLPEDGPVQEELQDLQDENKRWCSEDVRSHLTKALNLSQRYDLYRSSKAKPHSNREKDITARQDADEVLGLHQLIVAQSIAIRWLKNKLLVGHGKTELARRFGDLMSLELHVVDCTLFEQGTELFGPRPGFQSSEDGSSLNNFLWRNAGRRCIVFMDEFEKTSKNIHNTLLLLFQNGCYEDRRTHNLIDCSRTIWILATNQFDDSIHTFCGTNRHELFVSEDEQAQDKVVATLCRELRTEFSGHFGAPLGGRITEILPFLIFARPEAAVIVHKVLMDLESTVRKRVRLTLNKEDDVYVGNISIRIQNDARVCSLIAEYEYDKKTGARSIAQAVERTIQDPLIGQYLQIPENLDENQPTAYFTIYVNVDKVVEVRLKP
ncbi:hypothetical protein SLS62_009927 [Diatrype stigma]|uniref:ATPase AAA-type core domain-containing protein n=1 Tax=Diatrype stigma TaxID=117547 RepID=A0AAN9YHK2_9PEZI